MTFQEFQHLIDYGMGFHLQKGIPNSIFYRGSLKGAKKGKRK